MSLHLWVINFGIKLLCIIIKAKLLFLQVYWNLTWALIDVFTLLTAGSNSKMNNSQSENHASAFLFIRFLQLLVISIFVGLNDTNYLQDEVTVVGFEVPKSPDSSYSNVYTGNGDDARDPPIAPPHLQHPLLSYPSSRGDTSGTLPLPPNVILNHLFIEDGESPRSVVAVGFTHRFRSKFVTVVLYKPVQRRGSPSI